ncbi:MAG: hypothetical protein WC657_06090 [Candidatus Paceibacterota bacterium]|jgi:hypothetical protein
MTTTDINDRRIGGKRAEQETKPVTIEQPVREPQEGAERYNLDEIEARLQEDSERELAERPRVIVRAETPDDKLVRLERENDRMRAMIYGALEARNRAREFMTIWSDPSRLPELIQEIYISDPNIAAIQKSMESSKENYPATVIAETCQRAARLKAHIAISYQLHPLVPGMIYCWFDRGAVVTEIGWRGYQELVGRSEHIEIDGPRPMTDEEKRLHCVGPEDRGGIVKIYDWKKIDRFASRGLPAPEPVTGIGVWLAKNPRHYDKPDGVPDGRSAQWTSEKNALKDAARKIVTYEIVNMAALGDNVIDLVHDTESGVWSLPVQTAQWLKDQTGVARFVKYLNEKGVSDDDLNAFLGYNWRYSVLSPEEMKLKADECVAARSSAPKLIEGAPVEKRPDVPEQKPEPSPKVKAEKPPTGQKPDNAPKCRLCDNSADVLNLVDGTLCGACAGKEADRMAAKEATTGGTLSQDPLFPAGYRAESDAK